MKNTSIFSTDKLIALFPENSKVIDPLGFFISSNLIANKTSVSSLSSLLIFFVFTTQEIPLVNSLDMPNSIIKINRQLNIIIPDHIVMSLVSPNNSIASPAVTIVTAA